MSHLHLTLACEDYDRTRRLKDGIIKPEGIELNYLVMSVEEIFWRMMKYEEFDVSELSMGAFLTAAARGRRPFIAIPVFPSRTFRHRCLFVNSGAGIDRPQDLRGKRMGVPEYSMTAAVWLRGLFQHEYSIAPEEIHWIQAGEENPGRKDRIDFEPRYCRVAPRRAFRNRSDLFAPDFLPLLESNESLRGRYYIRAEISRATTPPPSCYIPVLPCACHGDPAAARCPHRC